MAEVWIPSLLRPLVGGQEVVKAEGRTLGEVIAALDGVYPGIAARLCEGDELAPHLTAWIDGRPARRGLREPVGAASHVQFLPTMGGG